MRFDLDLPDLGAADGYEYEVSVRIHARRVPAEECGPYPMPEPTDGLPVVTDPLPAQPSEPAAPVDTLPLDPVTEPAPAPVVTDPPPVVAEPAPGPAAPVVEPAPAEPQPEPSAPVAEVPPVPFPAEPPLIDPSAPVVEAPAVEQSPAEPAEPAAPVTEQPPVDVGAPVVVEPPADAGLTPVDAPAEPVMIAEPEQPAPVVEVPASSGGSIDAPDNAAVVPQPAEDGEGDEEVIAEVVPVPDEAAPDAPVAEPQPEPVAEQWVTVGNEFETVTVPEGSIVRYGSGDAWVQMDVSGTFVATNDFFGEDPAVGIRKQVQVLQQ